jgi:hypothetical protein
MDIKQTERDRLQRFTTTLSVKMTCGVSLKVNTAIDGFFISPHTSGVHPGKAVSFVAQISVKLTPCLIQYTSSIPVVHKN